MAEPLLPSPHLGGGLLSPEELLVIFRQSGAQSSPQPPGRPAPHRPWPPALPTRCSVSRRSAGQLGVLLAVPSFCPLTQTTVSPSIGTLKQFGARRPLSVSNTSAPAWHPVSPPQSCPQLSPRHTAPCPTSSPEASQDDVPPFESWPAASTAWRLHHRLPSLSRRENGALRSWIAC